MDTYSSGSGRHRRSGLVVRLLLEYACSLCTHRQKSKEVSRQCDAICDGHCGLIHLSSPLLLLQIQWVLILKVQGRTSSNDIKRQVNNNNEISRIICRKEPPKVTSLRRYSTQTHQTVIDCDLWPRWDTFNNRVGAKSHLKFSASMNEMAAPQTSSPPFHPSRPVPCVLSLFRSATIN